MPIACLQFQPDRLSTSSAEAAVVAMFKKHIPGAQFFPGNDEGRFINILFDVDSAEHAVAVIMPFLEHVTLGSQVASSTILTMEGEQGWDDYLLLHHFDPTVELDEVDDDE